LQEVRIIKLANPKVHMVFFIFMGIRS